MPYVVGVSSGIFAAAPEAERMQYATLSKKAEYCITKGVQFVQIDLESVAEFKSPNLPREMERIKRLGIDFGIHSETRAFGVEVAELDSAIELDYTFGHRRLWEILDQSGKIGSRYVLIHSSESEPFRFLGRVLQPTMLVDIWGRPLSKFIEQEKIEGKPIMDWVRKSEWMWVDFIGEEPSKVIERELEMSARRLGRALTDEEKKNIIEAEEKYLKDLFLRHIQSRALHYGPERIAYFITAKWMEDKKDPLWENIVKATVEFFAKIEQKTVEQFKSEKSIKEFSVDDEKFRMHDYLWVPAVSAKYIWGHLNQELCPTGPVFPELDLKQKMRVKTADGKVYTMPLVLETPMARRGIEEWLRLPNPIQMYYLAKEVNEKAGFECLLLAMDFEHMLSIKLEPEKVIDALPEDGGKYVRVIHAGYPTPLAPAHIPIPLGSEQQQYLYKMYYKLRKKGFVDPKKDFFLIFERGGGVDPIQQSIIALRKIIEFLEKDIKPEELIKYPEFYGIAVGELASPERQWATIREHAYEPLKGLIVAPEEEYTGLGRAAIERGAPPEKWKKEELR
ncbi:MAG: hypothetical protein QMD12_02235 [Candidatus Aenigmarchaeota archaeon]|nr:hypothetical protein [Candidatus Aenigmarchaeota archaeon]